MVDEAAAMDGPPIMKGLVEGIVCIPTKPAGDSDQLPATHSNFIPAGVPI